MPSAANPAGSQNVPMYAVAGISVVANASCKKIAKSVVPTGPPEIMRAPYRSLNRPMIGSAKSTPNPIGAKSKPVRPGDVPRSFRRYSRWFRSCLCH